MAADFTSLVQSPGTAFDRKGYMRAYGKKPDVILKKKAWRQSPAGRAYQKKYRASRKHKTYMRAYHKRYMATQQGRNKKQASRDAWRKTPSGIESEKKQHQRRWARVKSDPILRLKNNQADREYRVRHRERLRKYYRLRHIGRRDAQAGRPRSTHCELCLKRAEVVFDHCHTTEKFRGWICKTCNTVLAYVQDDVVLLRRMADYVESVLPDNVIKLSIKNG